MKKEYIIICVSLCFIFFGYVITAQEEYNQFDTIRFEKIDKIKDKYILIDELLSEVCVENLEPQRINIADYSFEENQGRDIGIDDRMDLECYLNYINYDSGLKYGFLPSYYCIGAQLKETRRTKNNDDSFSLQTSTGKIFYWRKGTVTLITESEDTICRYGTVMNPRKNTNLNKWLHEVYGSRDTNQRKLSQSCKDFALYGEYFGKESVIIYNSDANKFYLFVENDLKGIYIPDKVQLFVRTSKLFTPQLLVTHSLSKTERINALRLAIVAQWMKENIVSTRLQRF